MGRIAEFAMRPIALSKVLPELFGTPSLVGDGDRCDVPRRILGPVPRMQVPIQTMRVLVHLMES